MISGLNNNVLTIDRPDDALVILTLNRPARRNALTIELMEVLCESLQTFSAQTQLRVLILRGAGPAFCAGLDLVEAAKPELADRSGQCVARTFQALYDASLVTIAAVHGAVYAGGAGLMACCDFIVAADDLKVCFPEVRRGLVPALAATAVRLRLRSGDLHRLLLLAEPIDADQALSIGLVDRVVPSERLLAEGQAIAATILKGGPTAVRQTKQLLRELTSHDRQQKFAKALEFHQTARLSQEAAEGLAAFQQHREPQWPECIE